MSLLKHFLFIAATNLHDGSLVYELKLGIDPATGSFAIENVTFPSFRSGSLKDPTGLKLEVTVPLDQTLDQSGARKLNETLTWMCHLGPHIQQAINTYYALQPADNS